MPTTRFRIDHTEQFLRLPNAPIVEAVIQLNAPPNTPFERDALKVKLAERFEKFKVSDQMQLHAGLRNTPTGDTEMHQRTQWDGLRFESLDGKHICQWRRTCLVFSRLKPYLDWEQLTNAARPFWNAYRELGACEIIEGIGVRFISQIPLGEGEKPAKYVQKARLPLKGLDLSSETFFHQDLIPLKGYPYEVRLVRTMQRAAEAGGCDKSLIVDIDVSTTEGLPFEKLEQKLADMRYIKNKVFFTYMVDAEKNFA